MIIIIRKIIKKSGDSTYGNNEKDNSYFAGSFAFSDSDSRGVSAGKHQTIPQSGKRSIQRGLQNLKYQRIRSVAMAVNSGKTVKFTDKSTVSHTSYLRDFGDKSTSTAKNPKHAYSKAGKFTDT
jgi:plastocyanin